MVKVCPCCANGLPICADLRPNGTHYLHSETCETYDWDNDVCVRCAEGLRLAQGEGGK